MHTARVLKNRVTNAHFHSQKLALRIRENDVNIDFSSLWTTRLERNFCGVIFIASSHIARAH